MEIQGYNKYLIYDDGRVYNKKYKRYLKYGKDKDGYLRVCLSKDGKQKIMKFIMSNQSLYL